MDPTMETNPPSTTPPPPTEPTPPSLPTQQQTPTPPPPQQQQTAATPPPSSTPKSEIPTPSPSLNPNPSPSPQIPQSSTLTPVQQHQQSQIRPQQPNRTFSQFPSPNIPASSTFAPSSSPATSVQRGGVPALGVPAHQLRPPSQPAPFSNYPQYSGGLSRNPMTMPDSNTSQGKQPIQSVQTIGNFGSLTGSQIRQSGVPIHNQQPRALQGSIRTQSTPTQQSLANQQRFQSHPLLRPTMNSPSSSSSSTPQALQTHTQPWMSGTSQGKQMQPTYRQQTKPQTLQQRIYHPQQQHHHPMSSVPHQQVGSSQQQPQQQMPLSHLHQSQEHYGHQYPGGRVQQSIPHQQQAQRGIGPGSQKVPMTTMQTTAAVQPSPQNTAGIVDAGESSSHILSKRTIHELVSQIDPSEKLDPEVEDILIEIAEDFVDSITTVGCSLAKHRKSTTLEAKDILLHLERNWHMTLPGFGGDEIKGYKKQLTNDIHKERLAAVKKSMLVADAVNMKSAQAAGTAKGHAVRAAAPVPGSPKAHG